MKTKVLTALFLTALGMAPLLSQAQTPSTLVSSLQQYQDHLLTFPGKLGTLVQNNEWQTDQTKIVQSLADIEFNLFITLDQKPTLLDQMIHPLDHDHFNAELNHIAVDQSITYLNSIPNPEIANFLSQFKTKSVHTRFSFNIVQSSEFLSSEMPAGYVRGEHLVLMTYNTLNRSAWMTIFIHEISHFLDDQLSQAVQDGIALQAAHPHLSDELIAIAKKFDAQETITAAEQGFVDQWISLGFERGMMAEIRAWESTYTLYGTLRSLNLIQPVDWVESILANRQTGENMAAFCKRYFNGIYFHPHTGILSYAYLFQRMELIRAQKVL